MADQTNRTMVKATIGPRTNDTIEAIQAERDCTKSEATEFLLGYGSAAYRTRHGRNDSESGHRLAGAIPDAERLLGAEPESVPEDAPRDENDDPILQDK